MAWICIISGTEATAHGLYQAIEAQLKVETKIIDLTCCFCLYRFVLTFFIYRYINLPQEPHEAEKSNYIIQE